MVTLTFLPVGGFPRNGTRECEHLPPGTPDSKCSGDRYEACILEVECGGLSCPPTQQLKLARFLNCFEGERNANISAADMCASASGFSPHRIHTCTDAETAAKAAFAKVLAAAASGMATAKCFPWIVVDGVAQSDDPTEGCFGKDAGRTPLLPILCASARAHGSPLPVACAA